MSTQNTKNTPQDLAARSRERERERDNAYDSKGGSVSPRAAGSEAKRLGERGKRQVAEHATAARDQVVQRGSEFVEEQKSRAAEEVSIFGAAVREAGKKLKEEGQHNVASYAEAVADEMERAGSYLRDRDLRRLRNDASHFARERPGLFLGGMFLVGLAASRFLKASESHATPRNRWPDEDEDFLFEETTEEWDVNERERQSRSEGGETRSTPGTATTSGGAAPTAVPTSPPGTVPPSSSVPGTGSSSHAGNIPLPGEPARPSERPARPSDWGKTP